MILIVEDNADDSFLLARQMVRANLGNKIRLIGDGQDAMDFLRESAIAPTTVFLDLNLPRVNGVEILRSIRSEARFQFLPVVIMTHSVDPTDVQICTELGVTAFLPKPISLQTFTKIIGHLDSV